MPSHGSSPASDAWSWEIRVTPERRRRRHGNADRLWSGLPRVYYVHRGAEIVILLCGGDKRTQRQDIKRAQGLAERQ
jgi:hypothetical protein